MPLTLQERAARMFTVGFEATAFTDELKALIDRGVGGVIFFARNVGAPDEVAALISEIKAYAGRPLAICVDQEGGTTARLREGFTEIPSMRTLGGVGDPDIAKAIGQVIGREIKAVGFNLNFAPVLDVDTNPDNPIIATRSLSRDAEAVAQLGVALAEGLQSAGVGACGKHFPGHGDTSQDSHLELPRLPHSLDRLNATELLPFQAATESEIASLMTAHVIFDPIDPKYPATMSKEVLHGILREQMNYDGLIISDDLEMQAITKNFTLREAVILGAKAGIDMFLCCHTPRLMNEAIDIVTEGLQSGELPMDLVETANARLDSFLSKYASDADKGASDLSLLNCDAHRKVVQDLLARAGDSSQGPQSDPTEIMEQIRRDNKT